MIPIPLLLLAQSLPSRLASLSAIDLTIIIIYFGMVLAIGLYLKKRASTGKGFFLAGREMSAWVAGLSFLAANLGALELMGWAAAAYQYGILATHWYWVGAVPAMLFMGIVIMPFYYISQTHSVPGYLQLRFGEPTRALSAVSFAFMTILMSGVNMYSMAVVMKVVLGWDIHFSIWISSLTVAIYVALGGLLSAIFNEVLQFILIWAGAAVIPVLGLVESGGWRGLVAHISRNFPGQDYTHLWSPLSTFDSNPMGIHWTGIVFGLGLIGAFGYWTTDFLVVQRVMAARDLRSAQMAPVIGAAFKMLVPIIVILPGLLALSVLPFKLVGEDRAIMTGAHSYNEVLPLMLSRYCGPGMLGLGITALIAGFMSGMAGNVSAFATVWTYDIYRPYIRKRGQRPALRSGGTLVYHPGCAGEHCHCLRGDAFLQHYGLRPGIVQFLCDSAVWDRDPGNAVETRIPCGRLLGLADRDSILYWNVAVGSLRPGGARHHCPVSSRQSDGREHVSHCLVLADWRADHNRRQSLDASEARGGTQGIGLWDDSIAL